MGESVGLTWRSMQRASTTLNVQRRKVGMAGGWQWTLGAILVEDASPAGTFGEPATEARVAAPLTCLAAYNFEVPDDGLMHGVPHRD